MTYSISHRSRELFLLLHLKQFTISIVAALMLLALSPTMVLSQTGSTQPEIDIPELAPPTHPKEILDAHFGALKNARSSFEARKIEQEIWTAWTNAGTPTSALLLQRAQQLNAKKRNTDAIDLLDRLIDLEPDYVEGWNRRATILYHEKRYAESLSDISVVLSLEPRHFGALAGMASIMEILDRPVMALRVYEEALTVNPHMRGAHEAIERLEEKLKAFRI